MNKFLSDMIASNMPKLNERLAEGLAWRALQQAPDFLNKFIKVIAKDFPEGVRFDGCSRCPPDVQFHQLTNVKHTVKKDGKSQDRGGYDISKTDFLMLQLHFSLRVGDKYEPLPIRYVQFPFARRGGWMWISGTKYLISPMLCDRVVSVASKFVFIKLFRDMITIRKVINYIRVNNEKKAVYVAWSKIHKKKVNHIAGSRSKNLQHSIAHYLFAKHGFTDTFVKYCGVTPIVGTDDINVLDYPESEYTIFRSDCLGRAHARNVRYRPQGTALAIAIPNNKVTDLVINLISGFYYVADSFPEYFATKEKVGGSINWRIILGYLITGEDLNAGVLLEKTDEHLRTSLDGCLDVVTRRELAINKIDIETIYDLFAIVIDKFDIWTIYGLEKSISMYDKELSVLFYILKPIIYALNNCLFALSKLSSKKDYTIKPKDIIDIFNTNLKMKKIYEIKSPEKHPYIGSLSYSGDNMALKPTTMILPQSSTAGGASDSRTYVSDPVNQIHTSVAEVAGAFSVTKTHPDGRARLNLMVKTDENDHILRDEELMFLTVPVQEQIKRN